MDDKVLAELTKLKGKSANGEVKITLGELSDELGWQTGATDAVRRSLVELSNNV